MMKTCHLKMHATNKNVNILIGTLIIIKYAHIIAHRCVRARLTKKVHDNVHR